MDKFTAQGKTIGCKRRLYTIPLSLGYILTFILLYTSGSLAIPSPGSYTIDTPGTITGTFTVTGTMLTAWAFTTNSTDFTSVAGPTPAPNGMNEFTQSNALNGDRFLSIFWKGPGFSTANYHFSHIDVTEAGGDFTFSSGSPTVPEPTTLLLLATGLISLAGYRWAQRRRERVQAR